MSLDTCHNKSTYYFILVAQNILGSTWQDFGRGEFLVPKTLKCQHYFGSFFQRKMIWSACGYNLRRTRIS